MFLLLGPVGCDDGKAVREEVRHDPEGFELIDYVDPLIGTGGIGYGVGCGFPGASLPNGLVSLSPDTADASGNSFGAYRGGGYHFGDSNIQGFSHMHLYAVGLSDYGQVAFMPTNGMAPAKTTEAGYRTRFSHDDEHATPGAYEVYLPDVGVDVRLSATPRTGVHEYAFDAHVSDPTIIMDLGHILGQSDIKAARIDLDPETGHAAGMLFYDGDMAKRDFAVWFDAQFDPVPTSWGVWDDPETLSSGQTTAEASGESVRVGGWFEFDTPVVRVQVGISTVDADGARANRLAESVEDIDEAIDQARSAWSRELGVFEVRGGAERDRTIFSTGVYHSRLMPTLFSDADGRYRGFDDEIHTTDTPYYTDFSLWDTYRTLHPLMTAAWPETHAHMLESLAAMVRQGGGLPRWPLATWDGAFMVGVPATIVAAEAMVKGLEGWSDNEVLDHAIALTFGDVTQPYGSPPDVTLLDVYGYYPRDLVGTSVANTQEVAIADYALALAAASRGDDPETVARLEERAFTWENLYNPETGWMHGRNSDGSFGDLGNIDAWSEDYAEGNARQYVWMAPHVPERLIEVLGGVDAVLPRLTHFFEEAELAAMDSVVGLPEIYYWHGNEVDLHAAWLFSFLGRPDLTQQWVDWIWTTLYGVTGDDGLAGNDDGGTLSAWAVWAGVGLYPLAGTDRYVLGAPRFEEVVMPFGSGETLTIRRQGVGLVTQIDLDGRVLSGPTVTHAELAAGSVLTFTAPDGGEAARASR